MTANKIEKDRTLTAGRASSLRARLAVALGAMCLALGALGCSDGAPGGAALAAHSDQAAASNEPPAADETNVGSLSLALNAGGVTLRSITYTIIGGKYVKSGSLDVSNSTQISAVIGGIPFGTGYALTLSSSTAGPPQTDCSGSTTFDLNSAGPIPVPVNVTCKQAVIAVTPPPTTPMPAPIPQLPILVLALALLGLGVAAQTRSERSGTRV